MPLLDWCKQIAPDDAAIRLIPPCVTRIQTVKTIQNTVLHICFGTQPMGLREIDLSRYRNKVPERLVCYNWEKIDRSYWMDASNPNTAEKQQILDIAPRVFSQNMAYKWLDPIWAQETIRRVADRFKALWPRDADRIEQKTQDYLFDIFQLHLKIAETINPFPQKSFVDTNSRLQSLAERYGINRVGDLKVDFSTISSIREAVKSLQTLDRIVIFSGPRTQTTLKAVVGDSAQYAVFPLDYFGDPRHPKRNTYLGMMRYNLKQIEKGLSFLSNPS